MEYKKTIGCLLLMVFSLVYAMGQEVLELERAIATALDRNYSIQIENKKLEVSKNNISRAVSGQMPVVELTGGYEWGYSEAEIQTGTSGDGPNPPLSLEGTSNDLTLAAQVSMPIFQGFRGRYNYSQLQNNRQLSELQLQRIVEQTISQTVSAYLQVARLQAQLRLNQENLRISNQRVVQARTDAEFGTANTVRVLQAVADLNTDSAEYRTSQLEFENARRNLDFLLVQEDERNYRVEEELNLIDPLSYERLLEEMRANNAQLAISYKQVDNARLQSKISQSTFLPTVQGYANLSYLDIEDEASFLQSNQVFGPNVGVQVSLPVFTGGLNKIQRQNAAIQLEQQEIQLDQTKASLIRDLRNAFATYKNNEAQYRIEVANLAAFEQNFEKTNTDYGLGLLNETLLRSAQLNLARAKHRINQLKYAVKQSEITLLQLSGQLRGK